MSIAGRVRAACARRLAALIPATTPSPSSAARPDSYTAIAVLDARYGHRADSMASAEFRVFSQNGEDGVLAEMLHRIGVTNRYFVEFGVQDGLECNTRYLADVLGWSGSYIEADHDEAEAVRLRYANNSGVALLSSLVTPQNINELFRTLDVPPEFDVLSIDVDGQDYHIWEALSPTWRPRVVILEYNSALPANDLLVEPLLDGDPSKNEQTDYFGCSLGAAVQLANKKGYALAHAEMAGVNAFFVRSDLAATLEIHEVVRRSPNYGLHGGRHRADDLNRSFVRLPEQ